MGDKKLTSPMAQRWGVSRDIPAGRVYIGQSRGGYTGGTPTSGYMPLSDMTVDVEDAAMGYASLSIEAQNKIYEDMVALRGGYPVPRNDAVNFYADTVRSAYQLQQSRGLKVTPLEYWDYIKQESGGLGFNVYGDGKGGAGGRGGGYTGPTTQVGTYETINLTNPSQARQLLDDALGQVLGRRPTDVEYKNFTAALNAAQEEAPSITESVSTTTPQGKAKSTVKSKQRVRGGVSEAQLATEFARSQEMAAETAGGTVGFDAFLEAIGG